MNECAEISKKDFDNVSCRFHPKVKIITTAGINGSWLKKYLYDAISAKLTKRSKKYIALRKSKKRLKRNNYILNVPSADIFYIDSNNNIIGSKEQIIRVFGNLETKKIKTI